MTDLDHLTEQYYKARKSLTLFSGLLFAWEFVGLEITAQPVGNLDLRIQTPEAAPYVLLVLVGYFTVRLSIEWQQSPPARRATPPSRCDLALSLAIPVIAALTFGIQRFSDVKVAQALIAPSGSAVFGGIFVGLPVGYWLARRPLFGFDFPPDRPVLVGLAAIATVGVVVTIAEFWSQGTRAAPWFFVGALIAPGVSAALIGVRIAVKWMFTKTGRHR